MRAKRIPSDHIVLTSVVATHDLDGDELVIAEFICQSQSGDEPYEGLIEFNGGLCEEALSCSCPDFSNGFLCKHVIAALLAAGCPEEYLA